MPGYKCKQSPTVSSPGRLRAQNDCCDAAATSSRNDGGCAAQGNCNKSVLVSSSFGKSEVARRVAAERGEPLGASVGYAIRFDSAAL